MYLSNSSLLLILSVALLHFLPQLLLHLADHLFEDLVGGPFRGPFRLPHSLEYEEGSQSALQSPELYSELPANVYAASGALRERNHKVRPEQPLTLF